MTDYLTEQRGTRCLMIAGYCGMKLDEVMLRVLGRWRGCDVVTVVTVEVEVVSVVGSSHSATGTGKTGKGG